jgi:hypothetical protein
LYLLLNYILCLKQHYDERSKSPSGLHSVCIRHPIHDNFRNLVARTSFALHFLPHISQSFHDVVCTLHSFHTSQSFHEQGINTKSKLYNSVPHTNNTFQQLQVLGECVKDEAVNFSLRLIQAPAEMI